jgi:hypothetical protein
MRVNSKHKAVALVCLVIGFSTVRYSAQQPSRFDDSFVVTPHYVEYLSDTADRFARQAAELKRRLGSAPHVLVGFATGLPIQLPAIDLAEPLTESQMGSTLELIDRIVDRARANNVVVHLTLTSGFFHGMNDLRLAAIRQDVRNAQWFADGWIADPGSAVTPDVPPTAWITPSRYARLLRARMEEGTRVVGSRLAARMMEYPDTLLTVSGDGEVEFSFERSSPAGERFSPQPLYADYSPFMVQEFRDWIQQRNYQGDRSPSTDDDRDGHTFNRDFKTTFTTWRLRYFDSSGPIPYSRYRAMTEKLPSDGVDFLEGGFDAPRVQRTGDKYWELWMQFRRDAIGNYVRDFASWITTSPAPNSTFTVPPSHFYSHQIPADFLFGQKKNQRLESSASPASTAFIAPIGSAGVTAFNTFDGRNHSRTATEELFKLLSTSSLHWGVFEYNLSVPAGSGINAGPSSDMDYYMAELRKLYEYRPHVIVPFAWTDNPDLKTMDIQNSTFEAALSRFIAEVGNIPWRPRK